LLERDVYHPPTLAYRLDGAIIADGCLYTQRTFAPLSITPRRILLGKPAEHAEGLLCSDICSTRYFGDWLMTGLPLELLAEDRGANPIVLDGGKWPNEEDYRKRLKLAKPPAPTSPARFQTLWMIDDKPMNDGRVARYERLRARARTGQVGEDGLVYLERGTLGVERGLIGEEKLKEALVARGFRIVRPETASVAELAEALGKARICVGVEGSALTHATMLMPQGGAIVAIQPPMRFANAIKFFADAVGIRFGFVVGEQAGEGFSVPVERLRATLDLVDAAIG